MTIFLWARPLALAAALPALLLAGPAKSEDAHHGTAAMTCTNLTSGFNWKINVDYDHSTIDAHPAAISATEMSWHTPDGENYKLDRKSGNLTVIVASSTGGYFLYDRCKED